MDADRGHEWGERKWEGAESAAHKMGGGSQRQRVGPSPRFGVGMGCCEACESRKLGIRKDVVICPWKILDFTGESVMRPEVH